MALTKLEDQDADSPANAKQVSIDNCNIGATHPSSPPVPLLTPSLTGAIDPNAFDPSNPSGTYELDLADK